MKHDIFTWKGTPNNGDSEESGYRPSDQNVEQMGIPSGVIRVCAAQQILCNPQECQAAPRKHLLGTLCEPILQSV